MKLIWFPEYNTDTCKSAYLPECRLAVETALVRKGMPLFLPDWSEKWYGVIGTGVIINHLGRHIDERFAARYYSQAVLVVKAMPQESMYMSNKYSDALFSHDGSILVSKSFNVELTDDFLQSAAGVNIAGINSIFKSAVAAASRVFTLHTGDIIIIESAARKELIRDTRIILNAGEDIILNHKIK